MADRPVVSSGIKRRFRALACREWGISPAEFDDLVSSRRILLEDVADLVMMLMHDPLTAVWLMGYLSPEAKAAIEERAARQRDHERILSFLQFVKPKTEEDRAYLEAVRQAAAAERG